MVATDVGAIPDMLEGGCGIVVRAHDTEALITALESVISDADLAERLGAAAKARAAALYTVEFVVCRYIACWQSLVTADRPRRKPPWRREFLKAATP